MKLNSGKNKIQIAVCDDSEKDLQEILYYTEEFLMKKAIRSRSFRRGKNYWKPSDRAKNLTC